jgi:hypothetical protein
MKLAWMGVVLALTAATARADGDPTKASLARLRAAASCEDKASLWRAWCIATDWDKGTPVLPRANLIGLSIELADDNDLRKALSDKVGFVAFAVSDGKATLTTIRPTDKDEEKAVFEAVANLAVVFKGKARTAEISKDLAGYIKSLKGEYPTTKAKGSITWTGKSDLAALRKVGAFYVIIEQPPSGNGVFATILTDAWTGRP